MASFDGCPEVFHALVFIDCVQDFHQRILDDLVLQRGDAERALFSIRFWDVVTPAGLRPVAALM
ncbi:hypothetical protein C2738_23910 [Salmonella enterica subsp. enterica serovar Infantis]|nr:hypothetical protein [Salmonella enterica subsp. enterica serovar Infantis]MCH6656632.1 hypothetical protein [Escherichia coli]PBP08249.1 hypothetical protein CI707_08695 [Shigella sonnei]